MIRAFGAAHEPAAAVEQLPRQLPLAGIVVASVVCPVPPVLWVLEGELLLPPRAVAAPEPDAVSRCELARVPPLGLYGVEPPCPENPPCVPAVVGRVLEFEPPVVVFPARVEAEAPPLSAAEVPKSVESFRVDTPPPEPFEGAGDVPLHARKAALRHEMVSTWRSIGSVITEKMQPRRAHWYERSHDR